MKTILIALLLLSATTFAQTTYYAAGVMTGKANMYSKTFTWGDIEDVQFEIIMKGNIILINDQAKSTYTTYGKAVEKYINGEYNIGWDAIDEARRGCIIRFTKYNHGDWMLFVIYKNTGFGYLLLSESLNN